MRSGRTARAGALLLVCAAGCGSAEGRGEIAQARPPSEAEPPAPPRAPGAEEARGAHGPWTRELRLENAAFAASRAPSVVVHAPPAFDPARPLRLVVFLHGWSGCARVLSGEGAVACRDGDGTLEGWGLARRFDEAGTDALFVVPQLAFLERSGSPGRFAEAGRFRAFVEEMLAALGVGPPAAVESVALLAHSAGFETALALIARGGLAIDAVVLFDALYRGVPPFTEWVAAAPGRKLVSLHTGAGRTARQSRMLAARARERLGAQAVGEGEAGSLPELVRSHRVVIARSPAPHGGVPARHIPELLRALGLSARP